ncbi:MAG: hypothetical protein IJN90_02975 [Bacilli bacterium]|nr:hypothetical protein [Bacilli bacterium]
MKKKRICLLLIILSIFLFKIDVNAAGTCTKDEKQSLEKIAYEIDVNYEVVSIENIHSDDFNYAYNLVINNFSEDFYLLVGNYEKRLDYNVNVNTYENVFIGGGYNGKIKVYSSSNTSCPDTLIRSFEIWVPYYNKYSERAECEEYKEYDICKVATDTTGISEEEFIKKIDKIKESQVTVEPIVEEEKKWYEDIYDFYTEHKVLILSSVVIIIILIATITIVVKKKQKNKIKVDLEV